MERITSFSVDHTRLDKGMYLSRTDFGDIDTYDIRMKLPNKGDYLTNGAAHTLEHLFATYARNSQYKDNIVYIGPMGCMTGFYLIVKNLTRGDVIQLVQESMAFIGSYKGEIPGTTEPECGNYRLHDLPGAKAIAQDMCDVLKNWQPGDMAYPAFLD